MSRLGDPLILIGHEAWTEAEAALLAHPRWRCVYFDEVASIFVPRRGPSSAPGVPEFDFAAGPSAAMVAKSVPTEPHRISREAEALYRLGSVLRRRGGDPWRSRIPILVGAARRARVLLSRDATDPANWNLLGLIEWELVPDLTQPPPGPADPWDPATGLAWARATYGFRRALEAAPGDVRALKALAACFGVRRMSEARGRMESLLNRTDRRGDAFGPLEKHLEVAAGASWPDADRIAATFLHLGNPRAARRVWGEAADPPSAALRLTRMAGADLAEFDAPAAEARCRQALSLDPRLGEAWYLLAVARLEAGHFDEALAACRESLKRELTGAQRQRVLGVHTLVRQR